MAPKAAGKALDIFRGAAKKVASTPYRLLLHGGYSPNPDLEVAREFGEYAIYEELMENETTLSTSLSLSLEGWLDATVEKEKKKEILRMTTMVRVSRFQTEEGYDEPRLYKWFLAKVFGIVLAVHVFWMGACLLAMHEPQSKHYLDSADWPGWVAWIVPLLLVLVGACTAKYLRHFPFSHLYLILIALAAALSIAFITANYGTKLMFIMLTASTLIIVAISIVVFTLEVHMTNKFALWPVVLASSAIAGVVSELWGCEIKAGVVGMLLGGCLGIYYVYNLRSIMSDHLKKVRISEWVFAALSLYLDMSNGVLVVFQILDMWISNK